MIPWAIPSDILGLNLCRSQWATCWEWRGGPEPLRVMDGVRWVWLSNVILYHMILAANDVYVLLMDFDLQSCWGVMSICAGWRHYPSVAGCVWRCPARSIYRLEKGLRNQWMQIDAHYSNKAQIRFQRWRTQQTNNCFEDKSKWSETHCFLSIFGCKGVIESGSWAHLTNRNPRHHEYPRADLEVVILCWMLPPSASTM